MSEQITVVQRVQRATFNIKEAAAYFGIGVDMMYRLAKTNAVPNVRFGRAYRFRQADLDAYLEQQASASVAEPTLVNLEPVPVADDLPPYARLRKRKLPEGSAIKPISWR